MFLNSHSIIKLSSLCVLITMSVPSYIISTASYAQDNTTSPPGRIALTSDNSTLGAVSNVQDLVSRLLAKVVENMLKDGVSALELVTNNSTPMTAPPDEALLNTTIKTLYGIPPDADVLKRNLAQDILSKYKIFEYIGYATPRGDVYFAEPYSPAQTQVPTPNFAYRDHFQGAIATKGPFLSNIIKSVAYGTPHAAIAVPIYSQNDSESLIGVLVGGLNFTYIDQSIRSLNLTDNNDRQIILADRNGTAIFDSSLRNNHTSKVGSFASLQSFKNALEGRSGSMIEPFNGIEMLISYHPVKAVQSTWVLMLMRMV
jgi:hypothetical protein